MKILIKILALPYTLWLFCGLLFKDVIIFFKQFAGLIKAVYLLAVQSIGSDKRRYKRLKTIERRHLKRYVYPKK
jgi:hypothetical protein